MNKDNSKLKLLISPNSKLINEIFYNYPIIVISFLNTLLSTFFY